MAYYDDLTQLEYGTGSAERGAMGLVNRDSMLRSVSPSGFGLGGVGTAGEQKFINTSPSATDPMASNMQMPPVSSMLSQRPSRGSFYSGIDEGKVSSQVGANVANTQSMQGEFERSASEAVRQANSIVTSAELAAKQLQKRKASFEQVEKIARFAAPAIQGAFSKDKEVRRRAIGAGIGGLAAEGVQSGLDAALRSIEQASAIGAASAAMGGATGASGAALSEGAKTAAGSIGSGIASGVGSGMAALAGGESIGKAAATGAASGIGAGLGAAVLSPLGPAGTFAGKVGGGILGGVTAGLLGGGGTDLRPGTTARATGLPSSSDLLRS